MDAGQIISRRRNKALYSFFATKALMTPEQPNYQSSKVVLHRILGGMSSYYPFQQVNIGCACPTNCQNVATTPITLDETVMMALDSMMEYCAANNLGPTKSSRLFYLWFFTIAAGYSWITDSSRIVGTHDNWDWDIKVPLGSENDVFIYMNHLMGDLLPTLVPTFNPAAIYAAELTALNITPAERDERLAQVRSTGNWTGFTVAWNTWLAGRMADGSVAAAVQPTAADLPNGTQTLNVNTTTDDPNTFPQPLKWTKLVVQGTTQGYLTFRWNDVLSTGLSAGDETALKAVADASYPTDPARTAVVADLVALANGLTDLQKVVAEFWAGGPGTVSPPGMMIWFWKQFMTATLTAHVRGMDYFIYSGFDLAINLFETSRLVWGLKRDHMQARPIQEIRRLYRGQTLVAYDGTPIAGEAWVPYQMANFVTPPFADFPSGHSAFSQSFANIMSRWFGGSIPATSSMRWSDIKLICPILVAQTQPLGVFNVEPGASEIQVGAVPAAPITLTWATWQDLADSAGISRQYGGIHCQSAHVSSQDLANALCASTQSSWQITV
jgi:membrane-associated phospholipid phosphatase